MANLKGGASHGCGVPRQNGGMRKRVRVSHKKHRGAGSCGSSKKNQKGAGCGPAHKVSGGSAHKNHKVKDAVLHKSGGAAHKNQRWGVDLRTK